MGIIITGIMNIIQTKKSDFALWWLGWMGLILFVFAFPCLAARLILLPGDMVRDEILAGQGVSQSDMDRFISSRQTVVAWFPHHSVPNDLALLAMQGVRRGGDDRAVAAALLWEQRALRDAPANPFGWYRLAYLYFMQEGPSSRVEEAWRRSIEAAPFEPSLALSRLDMGMKIEAGLEEHEQAYLPALMRVQAKVSVTALAQEALRGHYVARVEDALAQDQDDLKAFREAVDVVLKKQPSDPK